MERDDLSLAIVILQRTRRFPSMGNRLVLLSGVREPDTANLRIIAKNIASRPGKSETASMKPDDKPPPKDKYFYFVDGQKYDSDDQFTTGAIIKSRLPDAKRGYALFLEGQGKDPDQLINDDTSINLEKEKGPKRFYTVPPASFGC